MGGGYWSEACQAIEENLFRFDPDNRQKNADAGIPHRRLGVVSIQLKAKLLCFCLCWRSWCFFNLWSCWSSCCWCCSCCTAACSCTATAGRCRTSAARRLSTAWLCFAARLRFATWLCFTARLSFAAAFLLAALHLCWLALFNLALHWLALSWLAAVLCFSCVGQQHCCQRDDQTEVSHDFNPSFSIRHCVSPFVPRRQGTRFQVRGPSKTPADRSLTDRNLSNNLPIFSSLGTQILNLERARLIQRHVARLSGPRFFLENTGKRQLQAPEAKMLMGQLLCWRAFVGRCPSGVFSAG